MVLYLLVDGGGKQKRVDTATDDAVKAKHWKELLLEQGKDADVVQLDGDALEIVQRFLEK